MLAILATIFVQVSNIFVNFTYLFIHLFIIKCNYLELNLFYTRKKYIYFNNTKIKKERTKLK